MQTKQRQNRLRELWPAHLAIAATLVVAVVAVYAQAGGHQYLNVDDDVYILRNPHIRSGVSWSNIRWAFTEAYEGYWLPLTWISFMLDMQLWGLDAGAQILENVAMHAAGSVLLYIILFSLTGAMAPSAWVAAVFALHPVHVESVAWVSQRKDVLSTLFWMGTTLAYIGYVRAPAEKRRVRYAATAATFTVGLLTKPTLVTLPLVLLLLDAWPLARRDKKPVQLLVEKFPLLVVASVAATITFATQSGAGAVQNLGEMAFAERLANVAHSYLSYIGTMLWPVNLAVFYPIAPVALPTAIGAACVLLAVTVGAILLAVRAPYVAMGWFWFLGVLVPVIGFVQVGGQAMADRYIHLPSIGLTIVLAWGVRAITADSATARGAAGALAVASVLAMAGASYHQLGYWRDSITIFQRAVDVTEGNFFAHNNLGQALAAVGRSEEAGKHYAEAVRIHPNYPPARNNLGTYLANQGKLAEAAPHFEAALAINPNLSAAENNLATIYARTGRPDLAIERYRRAIEMDPNNPNAQLGLGDVLMMMGRPGEAMPAYREALRLQPDWPPAAAGFARAQAAMGD